jgi:hypothetical protein
MFNRNFFSIEPKGAVFGEETKSNFFQWDNPISFLSSRTICSSAPFGNGWLHCESFNKASK